jgi:transcription factor SPT20
MDQATLVRDEPKPYGESAPPLLCQEIETKRYTVIDRPYILRKFNGCRPSMVIHLHQTNFRINDSQDPFSYTSPMKVLLEHLKKNTIPHEMLEELYQYNVQFYDGRSNSPY